MEIAKFNGIEIAYDRRGRGTPLVLIHGYPLDHSIWDAMTVLLENDFDLIVPDIRGFGRSTIVNTPYTMEEIADDIAFLLDDLKIEKAALAGHSMGGYVALAFAKKYPARVSGLALISSQVLPDGAEQKERRYKTAADVEEKGVGIVAEAMTDKLSSNQNIRNAIRPLIERQKAGGVVGAIKAMAKRDDSTSLFADINFPVVLVHGDADALIPIERAREVKAAFTQSHLVELVGVGHMPMMEVPEKTAEALKLLK